MLRARILSALVMIPVALAAIWAGGLGFAGLVAVAAAIMVWEWTRMVSGGTFSLGAKLAALCCGAAPLLVLVAPVWAFAALVLGLAVVLALPLPQGRSWSVGGMVYCGLPAIALVWLRGADDGGLILMVWLMALVWATDIGAYAAGRTIGGPLLLPRVSPKKTWAGLIGGMISAALVGALADWTLSSPDLPSPALLGALSAVLAVVAQAGDLFESWVKRRWGVKDSSAIIPGHGGVLDRVDGLLAAALVVAAVMLASDLF